MKELKFEELTTRQKLGMTFTATIHSNFGRPEGDDEFVFELIRNRSLGCVWIQQGFKNAEQQVAKVREIADYPILIMTDGESGVGEYLVGKHNAIGTTGSEKHAYAFGKILGVTARKMGYNVVCNPVLDMLEGSMRSIGVDVEKVTSLSCAEARGMHDGGVLTVGKHYPGGNNINGIDSHMAESLSSDTKESLLKYSLKPYLALYRAGLLDGIMASHKKFLNIDNEHPASLSRSVIDIIREQDYQGFIITDALCMMGIRARFGDVESKGLSINAGVDTILPYTMNNREQFEQYTEAYEKGLISDECLDASVKRMLEAQHKVTLLPTDTEFTDEDVKTFRSINKDGVYTRTDDGIGNTISRDGKHFFIIVAKQELDIAPGGKVDVDTFSNNGWLQPARIVKKINELFPNANYQIIHEFPSQNELSGVLSASIGCDELVIMTFSEALAYTGKEYLTHRLVNLITAMQITNRISTLIHFGNPCVLKELPHISRVIFGCHALESVDTTLEVLAGEYSANGVPTFDFKLQ